MTPRTRAGQRAAERTAAVRTGRGPGGREGGRPLAGPPVCSPAGSALELAGRTPLAVGWRHSPTELEAGCRVVHGEGPPEPRRSVGKEGVRPCSSAGRGISRFHSDLRRVRGRRRPVVSRTGPTSAPPCRPARGPRDKALRGTRPATPGARTSPNLDRNPANRNDRGAARACPREKGSPRPHRMGFPGEAQAFRNYPAQWGCGRGPQTEGG